MVVTIVVVMVMMVVPMVIVMMNMVPDRRAKGILQGDCDTMGGVLHRTQPQEFLLLQGGPADELALHHDPLQGGHPVLKIGIAAIRVTAPLGRLDLLAEDLDPFGTGEKTFFDQQIRQGEGLRLPGIGKDRPTGIPE